MTRTLMNLLAAAALAGAGLYGCGAADAPPADTGGPFLMQADRGAALFADHCAHCHGVQGEGTEAAPRLVGLAESALPLEAPPSREVRMEQFVTVGDVAAFASVNMPADAPGSLALDEYLAILAFALHANGIDLDEPLTLELASELVIPRD